MTRYARQTVLPEVGVGAAYKFELIGSDGDPALFETLVRDNPDMIAVIDLDGRFTFVSEAVRRILGLDPADLVGRDGFALIHPDDIGVAAESLGSTVAGGDGVHKVFLHMMRTLAGSSVSPGVWSANQDSSAPTVSMSSVRRSRP